jgi:hypothetical protein
MLVLAMLGASGGAVAVPSVAHAAISCVTWIDTNGDRGQLSCSSQAGSKGKVQLQIYCYSGSTYFWLASGWDPIVSGQQVRTWMSCPIGGVRGTRFDRVYT